jgi:UDP:flavonoid glycosyltransferase YjiC (YdhE family)
MRVLFTSTSGWGHIHPMLPLAHAFMARGDEVLWATGDEICGRLEHEGIKTTIAGLDDGTAMKTFAERYPESAHVPPPEKSDFMFPRLFGVVRAKTMLDDLLPVARDFGPDLVVCEQAEFAGPIVAALVGAPNITMSFGSTLPAPRVAATGDAVTHLWEAHGLEPRPYGGTYDNMFLDIYPASMQAADRPHIPSIQPLRPAAAVLGDEQPLPAWVTDDSADPLVYVTLGTVFSNDAVLSAVLDGLRDLPVRVVVTVGPRGEPSALGEQPDNVHVARYIPQTQLLEHCSLIVSHAGSGTFLAGLAAEIPQVCVPQAADQFFNAGACAKAGAGIALQPGGVTADAVNEAVATLLADASYREAATRIGTEIAAMPSPAEIADKLAATYG